MSADATGPLSICMVASSYPRFPGDIAGTFVASLAAALVGRGHRVSVVAPTTPRRHRVFPGLLTGWLHRHWGHQRPGYEVAGLLALFPPGVDIAVQRWDEPWYRTLYLPLRVLTAIAPPLATAALGAVATADTRAAAGDREHLFLRVRRA